MEHAEIALHNSVLDILCIVNFYMCLFITTVFHFSVVMFVYAYNAVNFRKGVYVYYTGGYLSKCKLKLLYYIKNQLQYIIYRYNALCNS